MHIKRRAVGNVFQNQIDTYASFSRLLLRRGFWNRLDRVRSKYVTSPEGERSHRLQNVSGAICDGGIGGNPLIFFIPEIDFSRLSISIVKLLFMMITTTSG